MEKDPGPERWLEDFDIGESSPTEENDADSDSSLISTHSSLCKHKVGKRLINPSQKDDFFTIFP